METACLRHTQIPHTSRLFSDFLYRYHKVEPFYTTTATSNYNEEQRGALVEALREQNAGNPSLDLLAAKGARAVVTGQQVGLFSGPAYSIYKALTAVKLARMMSESGPVPVVPVFWLATEDHDFNEVAEVWVHDEQRRPVHLRTSSGHRLESQTAGTVVPDEWPVEDLLTALKSFPFGDDVVDAVRDAYRPGMSMGDAFRKLMGRLLDAYGILFLDPLRPAVRKLAEPFLRKALKESPALIARLLRRNTELSEAGYHAQVHVDSRTGLLFTIEGNRRLALRDTKRSAEELLESGATLSPNALLRPVMQDYLLPTAAYIGGPAEIAYFAQSHVIYEHLLGRMPRVVSRSGFTLVDSRSAKIMQRFSLEMSDFFTGEEALRNKIAAKLIPDDLAQHFGSTQAKIHTQVDDLRKAVRSFDPTLEAALEKSRNKILYQIGKIQGKVANETLRREHRVASDTVHLSGALYPHKHLQERFYSILPFLAQHGFELIDTIYENVRLDCPDHLLLPVA